jgi:tRNA pseudouridine(38-40) synthase
LKSWKLTLEYDGTKYSGWQEQRNARTVQGQLRKAAEDFLGGEVDIQGAGRTDAGVHVRRKKVRDVIGHTQRKFCARSTAGYPLMCACWMSPRPRATFMRGTMR